jgi:hypothetical protein
VKVIQNHTLTLNFVKNKNHRHLKKKKEKKKEPIDLQAKQFMTTTKIPRELYMF